MVALPRNLLVDPTVPGWYHCYSSCVQQAFLCGTDLTTGINYDHRREWIQERLEFLASTFAVDVGSFALLQNHLHLVLRNRPDLVAQWSNEQVLRRARVLFPSRFKKLGVRAQDPLPQRLLQDGELVTEMRKRLSSLSWFMSKLCEWIAKRANAESGARGHFWASRFQCQRLLDELALLACCMYVDLNPIRAQLADRPETSRFTSAYERILAREARERGDLAGALRHDGWLCPLQLGGDHAAYDGAALGRRASNDGLFEMPLDQYLELLDGAGRESRVGKRGRIASELPPILQRLGSPKTNWLEVVDNFGVWFRSAAGPLDAMRQEADRLGRAWLQGMRRAKRVFN